MLHIYLVFFPQIRNRLYLSSSKEGLWAFPDFLDHPLLRPCGHLQRRQLSSGSRLGDLSFQWHCVGYFLYHQRKNSIQAVSIWRLNRSLGSLDGNIFLLSLIWKVFLLVAVGWGQGIFKCVYWSVVLFREYFKVLISLTLERLAGHLLFSLVLQVGSRKQNNQTGRVA